MCNVSSESSKVQRNVNELANLNFENRFENIELLKHMNNFWQK
jgi:hypothetical protein